MVNSNDYSICPFNSQHKIVTFRLPGHILKCQKSYRGPPLEICIYNACHLVQPGLMQEHLKICRERHNFHHCDYERSFRAAKEELNA